MNRLTQTILNAKRIKGNTFVGISNYTNKNGGISNKTIQVGLDFEKIKAKDAQIVTSFDPNSYESVWDTEMVIKAKEAILKSLTNPNKTKSDGQKNSYTHIAKGLKIHNESGDVMIHGIQRRSKTLVPGQYKPVNSRPLTILKKEIIKYLDLTSAKFVTLKLSKANIINMMGQSY